VRGTPASSELAPVATHLGLSVFRIAFFTVVLVDLAQLYRGRAISFATDPAWVPGVALPLALLAVAALAMGLATRYAAIASYVLVNLVHIFCLTRYHLDSFSEGFLFLFMFAPAPKALALDLPLRRRTSEPGAPVPTWFHYLFFAGMEVVYADSLLFKLGSTLWRDGLAFWMPAALPHFSSHRLWESLEIAVLVRGASYLALALELCFPLILLRRARTVVIAAGLLVHLSTAFFFPIPLFGLAASCVYLFFIDWRGLSPTTARPSRPRELAPALALVVLQVGLILAPYLPAVRPAIEGLAALAGSARHALYVDFHFTNPEPILRFQATAGGRTIPIPSFDEEGYPQVTGRYWCFVNFAMRAHASAPGTDAKIQQYLRGTLAQAGAGDADVTIYGKDVSAPLRLDFSADDTIRRRPWIPMGRARYRGGVVTLEWEASP
jgi:hypothetical protein